MKSAAIVLASILVTGLPAGLSAAGERHDRSAAARELRGHPAGAAAEPRPGGSIYQVEERFVDQTGTPVNLDVGRGHPVIISMFYASCHDACPLLIADIRRIEAALPVSVRADVRVVLVSLDPAHDTPAVLRGLAAAHGVDGERWRFLAGTGDGAREVAAVLGVRYRRLSSGAIEHSSVITLVDRVGVVEARIVGVAQPPAPIVERLVATITESDQREPRGLAAPSLLPLRR